MSGPLCLLSFPEKGEPDSVYLESLIGSSIVDNDQDMATLAALWGTAKSAALSADKSAQIIGTVRKTL
jgi:hypothetical protein